MLKDILQLSDTLNHFGFLKGASAVGGIITKLSVTTCWDGAQQDSAHCWQTATTEWFTGPWFKVSKNISPEDMEALLKKYAQVANKAAAYDSTNYGVTSMRAQMQQHEGEYDNIPQDVPGHEGHKKHRPSIKVERDLHTVIQKMERAEVTGRRWKSELSGGRREETGSYMRLRAKRQRLQVELEDVRSHEGGQGPRLVGDPQAHRRQEAENEATIRQWEQRAKELKKALCDAASESIDNESFIAIVTRLNSAEANAVSGRGVELALASCSRR